MKNNFYISFGVWITIIPFLGIPGTWRNTLVALSGLFLILVSLGPTLLKKLQGKSKIKKKQNKFNSQDSPLQNDKLRFSTLAENEDQIEAEKEI